MPRTVGKPENSRVLLASDDEEDKPDLSWKINASYATRYDDWRAKEETQKLKDKYGEDPEEDSSSSESEDEDAEGLTPELERDFFKTLSILKSKDPRMYDKSQQFYQENGDNNRRPVNGPTKAKPMFLKDYERKIILEEGGLVDEDKDVRPAKFQSEYDKEQADVKDKLSALARDNSGDEEELLLSMRQKTQEELTKEEADYSLWLKAEGVDKGSTAIQTALKPLKEFWSNPGLDEGEKFLRDYILDRKYIDKDSTRIPSYGEIVDEHFSEEETEIEKAEEFEHKYNFRFEEPDPDFIKRYPRTLDDSLRRKDDSRKKKRDEIKERREREKDRIREEIKQLKNLKRREIMQKIAKLRVVTGNDELAIEEDDIAGDFDPVRFDAMMHKAFDDNYYGDPAAVEKPELSDESDVDENWINEKEVDTQEDAGRSSIHRSEAEASSSQPCAAESKTTKRRRRTKVSDAVQNPKPSFDPHVNSLDEYLDEYYKLDFEDIVGGQPTRFKYRSVVPNSFGLSAEEILVAPDRELNAWCSLKKAVQHRSVEEQLFDVRAYTQKASLRDVKLKIIPTLADIEAAAQEPEKAKEKRKRRKKNRTGRTDGTLIEPAAAASEGMIDDMTKIAIQDPLPIILEITGDTEVEHPVLNKEKRKKSKGSPVASETPSLPKSKLDDENKHRAILVTNGDGVGAEDFAENSSVEPLMVPISSGKKKRKRKNRKTDAKMTDPDKVVGQPIEPGAKRLKATEAHETFLKSLPSAKISDERLMAYGLNPRKFRQKEKYVLLAKAKEGKK